MVRRILWARLAAGCAGLILAGCAARPAPPAIVSLDGRTCVARPALDTAQVVPPPEADGSVTAELGPDTQCLEAEARAKSAYLVFRLPPSSEPYLLGVASAPLGQTLFSPRLMLLDADGVLVREVPRSAFLFHGPRLYAGIRARPSERYLVVASDPGSVGQQEARIAGATQAMMTPAGPGAFVWLHSGSESKTAYIFAHNGSVTVSAKPWPKAN